MPITHKTRYEGSFFSSNGRYHIIRIYDKNYTGQTLPITIGSGGVKISYDTKGNEKFTPIIASKCSISLVVEDNVFGNHVKNFIKALRETYEEGDVTVAIWNQSTTTKPPLWSGNIMIDLSSKEDVSTPYEVELNATDGIGLLKNYDMVSVQGSSPYASADTYISDGYQTFIYWIKTILEYCNTPDSDSTDGDVSDYDFSTAIDWWYEHHPSPDVTISPLAYTKCQMLGSYKLTQDALYEVKTVYDVLESICKMWGMRVVFWQNRFHFTQIELYNTADTGNFATPDNVDSQIWTRGGASSSSQDYLGSTWFTLYSQDIETNAGGFDGGLQKLAGSTWDFYPKLKEVIVDFESVSNSNFFSLFPQPTISTIDGIDLITSSTITTFTGASAFSSFYLNLQLEFNNTSGSAQDYWFNWGIRAKPTTDANFNNGYYTQFLNTASATWTAYPGSTSTAFLSQFTAGNTFIDARINLTFPFGSSLSLPSGVSQQTIFSGIIPTNAAFTGSWDFEFFTYATIEELAGQDHFYGHHGQPVGGLLVPDPNMTTIGITYNDLFDNNGLPVSQFTTVTSSVIGGISSTTSIVSSRSETQRQEVKGLWWGDTPVIGDPSALMWDDGVGGSGYTDNNGLWRNGQSGNFDKLIQEVLGEARLYNQQQSDYKWSLSTAVSRTNAWKNDGTGARPVYINPVGRIYDQVDRIYYYFLRGTFDILKDEWDAEWLQVSFDDNISTTTTTTGGSSPSGNTMARLSAPSSGRTGQYLRLTNISEDVAIGTITSLPINPLNRETPDGGNLYEQNTIIKNGDKFILEGSGFFHEFTASADVTDTATTISVDSTTTISTFRDGDSINVNYRDLYKQYQHKDRGTIAGMEVTATTIDSTSRLGEYTVSFRVEGSSINSSNTYVCNGEDNNRSGRWDVNNSGGTSTITGQQSLKSARAFVDLPAKIQSGRISVSGTTGNNLTIGLYKVTPVDNDSTELTLTKLGEGVVALTGNPNPRLASLTSLSTATISAGDLIIPIITTDGSGVTFRGAITFTLKYD